MIIKKMKKSKKNNFRVGDKVIDVITNSIGIIVKIDYKNIYCIVVHCKDNQGNKIITAYTEEGKKNIFQENFQLLHYIKDFSYNKIDFKNPPERQKTWKSYINYIKYSIKQVF